MGPLALFAGIGRLRSRCVGKRITSGPEPPTQDMKKPPTGAIRGGQEEPLPEGYDMDLFRGHDAEVDYLLTVHDDGTHELAVRPAGSSASWSAPTTLAAVPAEVTC